jgi:ArsR family transcriptional regulator
MHYSICPPADATASAVLAAALAALESDQQMQADRARLARACCAPQELLAPEGAYRPAPINPHTSS